MDVLVGEVMFLHGWIVKLRTDLGNGRAGLGRIVAGPIGRVGAIPIGRIVAVPIGRVGAIPIRRVVAVPIRRAGAADGVAPAPLLQYTWPMGKRILPALALLFLLAGAAAHAQTGDLKALPLSSEVYFLMDSLYTMEGLGRPSSSRPWSLAEARQILDKVRRASLSRSSTALWDAIEAVLDRAKAGGFHAEANFEAYWHGNTAYNQESDWLYGFVERKPIAKLSADLELPRILYLYCDVQYGRNRFNIADDLRLVTSAYPAGVGAAVPQGDATALMALDSSIYSTPFLTNILEDARDFDYQWPKRAVASFGGEGWNFSFARDKLRWGSGRIGNFILDDHVDYHEYARFVGFSGPWKFDWFAVFFDLNTNQGEQPDREIQTFLGHRLEFRPLPSLKVAVSENLMYRNDSFDLRYLNPAFIYHNLNNRLMFNAIAHVEADWSPAKGITVYGQGVMDQGRAPTESSAQADAMGFLAGVEGAMSLGPGIFVASFEAAKTDPLLYRRDAIDFIMMRRYYTNGDPTGPGYIIEFDYPGFEYGGDALAAQADLEFRIPGKARLALRAFGMRHGEMDFFKPHSKSGDNGYFADYEGTTPSGDVIRDLAALRFYAEFSAPPLFKRIQARTWLHAAWVARSDYTKSTASRSAWEHDVQLTAGCSLAF